MEGRGIMSIAGPIFFAAFAILFFGGAYAIWPPDFFGVPFAEMTSGTLLRAAVSPVLALVGLEFLGALAIVTLADD
jgi:hypothetical protein